MRWKSLCAKLIVKEWGMYITTSPFSTPSPRRVWNATRVSSRVSSKPSLNRFSNSLRRSSSVWIPKGGFPSSSPSSSLFVISTTDSEAFCSFMRAESRETMAEFVFWATLSSFRKAEYLDLSSFVLAPVLTEGITDAEDSWVFSLKRLAASLNSSLSMRSSSTLAIRCTHPFKSLIAMDFGSTVAFKLGMFMTEETKLVSFPKDALASLRRSSSSVKRRSKGMRAGGSTDRVGFAGAFSSSNSRDWGVPGGHFVLRLSPARFFAKWASHCSLFLGEPPDRMNSL